MKLVIPTYKFEVNDQKRSADLGKVLLYNHLLSILKIFFLNRLTYLLVTLIYPPRQNLSQVGIVDTQERGGKIVTL